jgi:tRNA dimethylallyltransferase
MDIDTIPKDRPVLIAGPTASGKSALALAIAARQGGVIVNADALQVYQHWNLLTARPSTADLSAASHLLYGHIAPSQAYSVGDWLTEVRSILNGPSRPIIVGGTGLYFLALTEGLAAIPPTPADIRQQADLRRMTEGTAPMLAELDTATRQRIDSVNPMRVQRAWEVQKTTGFGLAHWHDQTGPATLSQRDCTALVVDAPKEWLTPRIAYRFDLMLKNGALLEAARNLPDFDQGRPSDKAIGAKELIAHLKGELPLDAARELALISTTQYAKRQRTWFSARMRNWTTISAASIQGINGL